MTPAILTVLYILLAVSLWTGAGLFVSSVLFRSRFGAWLGLIVSVLALGGLVVLK